MGDLVLPLATDWPLVFVAGGIGIASFASMFQELLARKEERPIYFFYQLRSRREQIFRDLTDAYPLELQQNSIAPNQLSAKQIKDSTPPEALIYLSGSQKFVENLQTEFEKSGTPRQQILFDYYDGYSEL
jgi:ferredoxin-NADP reductase